jgi:hypothetical protein
VLKASNSYSTKLNIQENVEELRKAIFSIDLTLKSNYKLFLSQTIKFMRNITILKEDLFHSEYKLIFLLKVVRDEENRKKLLILNEFVETLKRQFNIFSYIYELKLREK